MFIMEIQLNQIQNLIFSSLFSIRFLLSPFDTVANRRLYFNVTRRTLIHIQIIFFRAAAVVGIESEISSLLKCLIPAPSEQHNKYINEIKILYKIGNFVDSPHLFLDGCVVSFFFEISMS